MCRSLYLIQMPPFHLNNTKLRDNCLESLLKHVVFVNTCIFVQHSCNNWMNVGGGTTP